MGVATAWSRWQRASRRWSDNTHSGRAAVAAACHRPCLRQPHGPLRL